MNWSPKNKAEQLFKELFDTKSNMANELGISRPTIDRYFDNPNLLNRHIKRISKLKRVSELKLYKAINE
jgi:hypothetical protein|tara:strand:+ start:464 stop:670 length:207 start_codon:yes stop_codon:yes gene_type:complete